MAIEFVCPNGHPLKVKDSLAGKMGLCPVCKVRVAVPRLPQSTSSELTEDAILGILGPHEPDASRVQTPLEEPAAERKPAAARDGHAPPKKSCSKCNAEIPAGVQICPHCRTYLAADLTDLVKRPS